MTSDVIEAIDWAIANRARYRLRVINLSLGHPVFEPAADDPLCQAVARAAAAGLVVVAAAGNLGKLADGTPVVAGIESPGNSPFAITVGALNTRGTAARSDDTVATYSSRGPTPYRPPAEAGSGGAGQPGGVAGGAGVVLCRRTTRIGRWRGPDGTGISS